MPKKKKVRLSNETIQGVKDWYKNAPEIIAYNMLGLYLLDKRQEKKFPKIKFINVGSKAISNPFKNVKSWDQIRDPIIIGCNYSALQQVLGDRPVAKIKNEIRKKMMQSWEIIDGCSISCVQTPPKHHNPLVYYESVSDPFGKKSVTPNYLKYQFQNEQAKSLFGINDQYTNDINQPMIGPIQDIHTRPIPYSWPQQQINTPFTPNQQTLAAPKQTVINNDGQMPLPTPLQTNNGINATTPLQQGPAQQNIQQNQDKLEPVEAKPGTIQEVIEKVGKDNFFTGNGKLDEIDIKYNRPRGRGKAIITDECDDFAEVNYKKDQGAFPIIREMLQRVLSPDEFKKVGYNSKKNKILLPDSAFTGLVSELQYLPDLHNSPYARYINDILQKINNDKFLKPKNTKELIFLAINRIKADYQAACLAYKQTNSISPELLEYSNFKGHYSSSDDSLGIRFKGTIDGSLKPLFCGKKALYSNIESVSYNNPKGTPPQDIILNLRERPEFKNINSIITTNNLPEFYKHGLLDPKDWKIKLNTLSFLTKQNETVTGKIAKGQLDVYKNAATLAALDGRTFPSGDINQDKKYLLHAHIFTVFNANNITLQDNIELTNNQKQQADKHKYDNPFFKPLKQQISQYYTGNRPMVRTLKKDDPNKQLSTKEIVKEFLNFAYFDIQMNTPHQQFPDQLNQLYWRAMNDNNQNNNNQRLFDKEQTKLAIKTTLAYHNIDGQSLKNYDLIVDILEDLSNRLYSYAHDNPWSPKDELDHKLQIIQTGQIGQTAINNPQNNVTVPPTTTINPYLAIPKIEKVYANDSDMAEIKYEDINALDVQTKNPDGCYSPQIVLKNQQRDGGILHVDAYLSLGSSSNNYKLFLIGKVQAWPITGKTGLKIHIKAPNGQIYERTLINTHNCYTTNIPSQQITAQQQDTIVYTRTMFDLLSNISESFIKICNFCYDGYIIIYNNKFKNFKQIIEWFSDGVNNLKSYIDNNKLLAKVQIDNNDILTKFKEIGELYNNICNTFQKHSSIFSKNGQTNIQQTITLQSCQNISYLQQLNTGQKYNLKEVLDNFYNATNTIYQLFQNMQQDNNIMEQTTETNDWKFKDDTSNPSCCIATLKTELAGKLDKIIDTIHYYDQKTDTEKGLFSRQNHDTIFCKDPTVAVSDDDNSIMLPFGIKMPVTQNNQQQPQGTGCSIPIMLLGIDVYPHNNNNVLYAAIQFGDDDTLYEVPVNNGQIVINYKNDNQAMESTTINIDETDIGKQIGHVIYNKQRKEIFVNSGQLMASISNQNNLINLTNMDPSINNNINPPS